MRVTRRSAVPIPKAPARADLPLAELVATVDYTLAATTEPERKYAVVYELLLPRLYDFARRYLEPDAAEDAVHDAMLSIWQRREQVFIPSRNAAFFFRVVKNRISSTRLRERRRLVRMTKYLYYLRTFYEVVDPVDVALEHAELATVIDETVATMPKRCRAVWVLVRENGMTYDQAAEALGLALPTVKRHMTRAQTLLREALVDAGYREPPKLVPASVAEGGPDE